MHVATYILCDGLLQVKYSVQATDDEEPMECDNSSLVVSGAPYQAVLWDGADYMSKYSVQATEDDEEPMECDNSSLVVSGAPYQAVLWDGADYMSKYSVQATEDDEEPMECDNSSLVVSGAPRQAVLYKQLFQAFSKGLRKQCMQHVCVQ